jgi:hypothetical protein
MTFSIKHPLTAAIIWLCFSSVASAEMFKCMIKGRPTYQSQPCNQSQTESVLTIKESTPEQKALAQEKLQAIRNQYESEKNQKQQKIQQEMEKQLQIKPIQIR